MKKLLTLLAMVALVAICAFNASAKSPKAVETAVFTVTPQMTCQNCENKIKSNLRFEKGVSSIETNIDAQTVTVTYDPAKTNPENLTGALKKIGYEASAATGETKCAKAAKQGCCKKDNAEGKHCGGCKKANAEGGHCGGCKK